MCRGPREHNLVYKLGGLDQKFETTNIASYINMHMHSVLFMSLTCAMAAGAAAFQGSLGGAGRVGATRPGRHALAPLVMQMRAAPDAGRHVPRSRRNRHAESM